MSCPETLDRLFRVLRAVLLAAGMLYLWVELILWFLNLRRNAGEVAVVVLVMLGALPLAGLRNVNTRRKERLIQREAERWSIHRRAGPSRRTLSWHARFVLAVPSIVALLFFVFEPEAIGIWQHILHPGPLRVGQYRISTPLTSMLVSVSDRETPEEQQWIMNEEGIARMGRHPYLALGRPIWYMGFSTAPLEAHPLTAHRFPEFLANRAATVADREFLCQELQYNGTYVHAVTIACSGTNDSLHIHFEAETKEEPAFYEFLQHQVWLDKP